MSKRQELWDLFRKAVIWNLIDIDSILDFELYDMAVEKSDGLVLPIKWRDGSTEVIFVSLDKQNYSTDKGKVLAGAILGYFNSIYNKVKYVIPEENILKYLVYTYIDVNTTEYNIREAELDIENDKFYIIPGNIIDDDISIEDYYCRLCNRNIRKVSEVIDDLIIHLMNADPRM